MNHLSTLMKTKTWYCLFATTVLIAVAFCVRQRTLNELRASNQSLRHQLDAQVPTLGAQPTPAVQPTNPVAVLSPDERTELLRLRGQILPLRRELQEMSNRVGVLAQPAPQRVPTQSWQMPSPQQNDRKAEIQAMNEFMRSGPYRSARNLNIALGNYIEAHSGELPDDLAKLEASAGHPLPQGVSQRFELIRSGTISEEALSCTFVAREKQPQQLADGRWIRLYLRADGGTVTATLGPVTKPDWKVWERSNETFMKQEALQKQERTQP